MRSLSFLRTLCVNDCEVVRNWIHEMQKIKEELIVSFLIYYKPRLLALGWGCLARKTHVFFAALAISFWLLSELAALPWVPSQDPKAVVNVNRHTGVFVSKSNCSAPIPPSSSTPLLPFHPQLDSDSIHFCLFHRAPTNPGLKLVQGV